MKKTLSLNEKAIKKFLPVILIFLPLLLVSFTYDNDIWFLLNHGRYVAENVIPYTEPFTIHSGMSFVMQQWLSAVILYFADAVFGRIGVYLLMETLLAVILVLQYRICLTVSRKNVIASVAATVLSGIISAYYIRTRPQSFTMLIITCELLLLERYVHTGKKQPLIVLIFLSVLEINLHASMWPMLFIFMLPYIVGSIKIQTASVESGGYRVKPLFVTGAAMLIAGFANPYGWKAMTYVFRSYGVNDINGAIEEMCPFNIFCISGILSAVLIALYFAAIVLYRKGKVNLRYILLIGGNVLMVLMQVRNIMFFAVAAAFPMADYFRDFKLPEPDKAQKPNIKMRKTLVVLICFAICGAVACAVLMHEPDENKTVAVADYIVKKNDVSAVRLYCGYNDGGYFEYRGIKTYIDPRAEVFLKANNDKEDIFREYLNVYNGKEYYKEFLDKYNFTHIYASKKDIMFTYLPYDDKYMKVYEDDYGALYVPAGKEAVYNEDT